MRCGREWHVIYIMGLVHYYYFIEQYNGQIKISIVLSVVVLIYS